MAAPSGSTDPASFRTGRFCGPREGFSARRGGGVERSSASIGCCREANHTLQTIEEHNKLVGGVKASGGEKWRGPALA